MIYFLIFCLLVSSFPTRSLAKKQKYHLKSSFLSLSSQKSSSHSRLVEDFMTMTQGVLKEDYFIQDQENIETLLKQAQDGKSNVSPFYSEWKTILENYNSYQTNLKGTLRAIEKFQIKLREERELSPYQKSKILFQSSLSLSWFYFQNHQRNLSQSIIESLLAVHSQWDPDLSLYPRRFRKHFSKVKREFKMPKTVQVIPLTQPESVSLFVDGLYVGESPLPISLKPGAHEIVFAAHGRESVRKKINLLKGEELKIKARLKWRAKKKDSSPLSLFDKNESVSIPKLETLSETLKTPVLILFDMKKVKRGYLPQVTLYHSGHSQITKTISYFKPFRHWKKHKQHVVQYFAAKIKPYLNNNLIYWQKNIEREVVYDQQMYFKKKFYQKPEFWLAVGGVVAAGVIGGVLINQNSSRSPGNGGVVIQF